MMITITIPVQVAGDHWVNPDQVSKLLETAGGHAVVLDMGAEGASLHRLGIVDHVLQSGINPLQVTVAHWPNTVESIPFVRAEKHRASHFFWHHRLHTKIDKFRSSNNNRFGLFVGRRTWSRCRIVYDVFQQYHGSCLSLMGVTSPMPWHDSNQHNADADYEWVDPENQAQFWQWWATPPVGSLDHHQVGDQYVPGCDTNSDLLQFYDQFDLEIVCESYCYGNTFFPTEKTVRPIAAAKAFVTFGPANFLQRLRNLGFRTFGDLWNESYDQLEGLPRWIAMQHTLEHIRSAKLLLTCAEQLAVITQHNQQNLLQVVERYSPQ
jgi:hypothetical protein